jgi:hypothetical protein
VRDPHEFLSWMCSVRQEGQEPLRESEIYNIVNLRPTSVVALFAMIDKVPVCGSGGIVMPVKCVRLSIVARKSGLRIFRGRPASMQGPLTNVRLANIRTTRTHKRTRIWQSLDRFGEERLDEMLTVITSILTAAPEEDEMGAAGEHGEDEEAMQT